MTPRIAVLLVLVELAIFSGSQATIITRVIDAQKALIAQEEALLEQARAAVRDRADRAVESTRERLLNMTDQMRYFATHPFHAGAQIVERSRQMIGRARTLYNSYSPSRSRADRNGTETTTLGHEEEDTVPYFDRMRMQTASWPTWNTTLGANDETSATDVVSFEPDLRLLSDDDDKIDTHDENKL